MREKKIWYALTALVTILVYARSAGNGAVWDDTGQVVNNPYLTSLSHVGALFTHSLWETTRVGLHTDFYRPLTMLSFAIDRFIGGDHPMAFHVGNTLLACVNAVFFAALLFQLTGRLAVACTISLACVLAPINCESIAWISGRFDVLSVTFSIVGLWLIHRKKLGAAIAMFALGILSKEVTYFVAPMALLYALWIADVPRRRVVLASGGVFAMMASYVALRAAVGVRGVSLIVKYSLSKFVISYAHSALLLGRLTFYPAGIDALHAEQKPSLIAAIAVIAMIFAALALSITWWARSRSRGPALIAWGLSLWAICLLPPAFACAFLDSTAERYASLPNVGLFIALAGIVDLMLTRWPQSQRALVAMLGLWVATGSVITFQRIGDWKSETTLYEASLRLNPDNPRALASLAAVYVNERRFEEAEPLLTRSLAMSQKPWRALSTLCVSRINSGRVDEAEDFCRRSVALCPENSTAWMNIAHLHSVKRDWPGALAAVNEGLKNERSASGFYMKAIALANTGDESGATRSVSEALAIDSSHVGARTLARALSSRGFMVANAP